MFWGGMRFVSDGMKNPTDVSKFHQAMDPGRF
jgi:hypothetical protein